MTHPEDRDGSTPPSERSPGTTAPDTTAPDTTAPDTTAPDITGPGREEDEHAWVTRLLARTPVEPIPDDVAVRLDGVLADLVAERHESGSESSASRLAPHREPDVSTPDVPSLDARRDRAVMRVVRGLLATAAVLVLLVGGAYMTTHLAPPGGIGGGGSSASSADSASGSEAAPRPTGSGTEPFAADGELGTVPRLTRAAFAEQMHVLLDRASVEDLGREPSSKQQSAPGRTSALAACSPVVAATAERAVLVLLDDRPAVVEIYPARDGRRLVRAIGCDGAPLTTASVSTQ